MQQVVQRMHLREMTIAYGQTEASPLITQTRTDDPIDLRVSTVGRPLPHVEVRILDPETGLEVPRGVQGELCCRGYLVMRGYYRMPEATAATIDRDGWLHTGDLATMDDRSYCRITGRIKDMVIRGGQTVYPREIEEFLHAHPKVRDVQVFGVPDARLGEELAAWIRLHDGESAAAEEIREFCRNRIAHYKIPRYTARRGLPADGDRQGPEVQNGGRWHASSAHERTLSAGPGHTRALRGCRAAPGAWSNARRSRWWRRGSRRSAGRAAFTIGHDADCSARNRDFGDGFTVEERVALAFPCRPPSRPKGAV
jgi:hypothetical protein